ncbi:hypothetical protein D5S17_09490 [Pseudonocardiaceae bacterium YIM PH 21723]|nr:hypothetical protein D5S17_09490 [Pseudonocardiaceae bacterium YIM PH 21723]
MTMAENSQRGGMWIGRIRRVNRLVSLYVLAIQNERPYSSQERKELVTALRGLADLVEQAPGNQVGQEAC